jgi:outer membrane lipoprotein LolB
MRAARIFTRWRDIAVVAIVCGLLAACAIAPAVPVDSVTLGTGEVFALEGRVSVRYGDASLSGKIAWAHTPLRDEIRLASPLGNQLALIVREAAGVTLTDSNQMRYEAADVETLTEHQLGWRLPLAGLSDWVRARPTAGAVARRDANDRPVHFSDAGWEIDLDYDGEARLPRRLVMVYTRAERALEIRLVVDGWA